jgi:hypothetical protein
MFMMWVVYLAFLVIAQGNMMDGWFFAVALVTMIPMLTGMGIIWRMYREDRNAGEDQSEEKRKRDRLDTVLRDLSDDDLMRLRERLSDGSIDDEVLYQQMIGADGEFTTQRA